MIVYFETKHLQMLILKHSFHSQWQWFGRQIKQIKNDYGRAEQCNG